MMIEQVKIIHLPKMIDSRGKLGIVEGKINVPFDIRRIYYLYDVLADATRGAHAHKQLQQLIVAIAGSFEVVLDDGVNKKSFTLNKNCVGLYLPKMIWRELKNFSTNAVCLVLASEHYDEDDYYRNYEDFIEAVKAQ